MAQGEDGERHRIFFARERVSFLRATTPVFFTLLFDPPRVQFLFVCSAPHDIYDIHNHNAHTIQCNSITI